MNIFVCFENNRKIKLHATPITQVDYVKQRISEITFAKFENIILFFNEKELEDNEKLIDYDIKENANILCKLKVEEAAPFVIQKEKLVENHKNEVNFLISMGFERGKVIKALKRFDFDTEKSIQFLSERQKKRKQEEKAKEEDRKSTESDTDDIEISDEPAWTTKEDELLYRKCVKNEFNWGKIRKDFPTRTCYSLKRRWRDVLSRRYAPENEEESKEVEQWTKEDNNVLRSIWNIYNDDWKTIQKYFPNRTEGELSNHFNEVIKPAIEKEQELQREKEKQEQEAKLLEIERLKQLEKEKEQLQKEKEQLEKEKEKERLEKQKQKQAIKELEKEKEKEIEIDDDSNDDVVIIQENSETPDDSGSDETEKTSRQLPTRPHSESSFQKKFKLNSSWYEARLLESYRKYDGDWVKIINNFPEFSLDDIKKIWDKIKYMMPWKPIDDEKLIHAYNVYDGDWVKINEAIPYRSIKALMQKYKEISPYYAATGSAGNNRELSIKLQVNRIFALYGTNPNLDEYKRKYEGGDDVYSIIEKWAATNEKIKLAGQKIDEFVQLLVTYGNDWTSISERFPGFEDWEARLTYYFFIRYNIPVDNVRKIELGFERDSFGGEDQYFTGQLEEDLLKAKFKQFGDNYDFLKQTFPWIPLEALQNAWSKQPREERMKIKAEESETDIRKANEGFTDAEDMILKLSYEENSDDWTKIQHYMPHHSIKQISRHWESLTSGDKQDKNGASKDFYDLVQYGNDENSDDDSYDSDNESDYYDANPTTKHEEKQRQKKPKIEQKTEKDWGEAEEKELVELIHKFNYVIDIANSKIIFKVYRGFDPTFIVQKINEHQWTKKEDNTLLDFIITGEEDWYNIQGSLPKRTIHEIKLRAEFIDRDGDDDSISYGSIAKDVLKEAEEEGRKKRSYDPNNVGTWSAEENQKFIDILLKNGLDFQKLMRHLPHRKYNTLSVHYSIMRWKIPYSQRVMIEKRIDISDEDIVRILRSVSRNKADWEKVKNEIPDFRISTIKEVWDCMKGFIDINYVKEIEGDTSFVPWTKDDDNLLVGLCRSNGRKFTIYAERFNKETKDVKLRFDFLLHGKDFPVEF